MRAANEALVSNMAACSAPGARLVYFSSLSPTQVPSDERPASTTAYGWEKRAIEKLVRREASRQGKQAWNLRLGHVTGDLQAISVELRRLIRSGPVVIPWAGDYPSNVVYTATIVEAVLAIAAGREAAGPTTWSARPDGAGARSSSTRRRSPAPPFGPRSLFRRFRVPAPPGGARGSHARVPWPRDS